MKIEIGKQRPEHFQEAWPGEYGIFSHFESAVVVPQTLSMITTRKVGGQNNAAFHAGISFTGNTRNYYVVLTGINPGSHTYENIMRCKSFCINFLPGKYLQNCFDTIENNGDDTDELEAGGLTAEPCKEIDGIRIAEALVCLECELSSRFEIDGLPILVGQVQCAAVEDRLHTAEEICSPDSFMYYVPSPQNLATGVRSPQAFANLTTFLVENGGESK